jgi:hypothetical protein
MGPGVHRGEFLAGRELLQAILRLALVPEPPWTKITSRCQGLGSDPAWPGGEGQGIGTGTLARLAGKLPSGARKAGAIRWMTPMGGIRF